MTVLPEQPLYLQNGSYSAEQDRNLLDSIIEGEGVCGTLDFQITAAGGTLTYSSAAGMAYVRGDTDTTQGIYEVTDSAGSSSTVSAGNATNPRLDQVVLRVYDNSVAGGGSDEVTIETVAGTATAGATLNNRNGAASLPSSALLLADILVPATATTISDTDIRDRRKFAVGGPIPPIVANKNTAVVAFEGVSGVCPQYASSSLAHASHDTKQVAILQYLPRRIIGATGIKFRLGHSGTALAGNYNVAIYDASGRSIVSTGVTAITGSLSTSALQSVTITATDFDAGLYYVFIGIDTSAGTADCFGTHPYGAYAPNIGFYATSGGTTVPTTILGLTDIYTATPAVTTALPVLPQIILSVG